MKNLYYEIETVISNENYHMERSYVFYDLEEAIQFVLKKRNNLKITKIKEYRLVHNHPFHLPAPDYHDDFTNQDVYVSYYRIPDELHRTVKQKEYKHKFIEDKVFDNYCIEYEYLYKHEYFDIIIVGHATYDTRDHNRKGTMQAFYSHTKSKIYFNVSLYQYRLWEIDEFIK